MLVVDTQHLCAALSKVVNHINHEAEADECTTHPRVLVLHGSSDVTRQ
jgi:hypothetical protein